jgi:5'-3' exoribonuclease 2
VITTYLLRLTLNFIVGDKFLYTVTNSVIFFRWLTDAGEVHLDRVQIMMKGLGEMEDQIFVQRQQREERYKQQQRDRNRRDKEFMPQKYSIVAPLDKPPEYMSATEFKERRKEERMQSTECKEAEIKLKSLLNITSAPVSDSGRTEIQTPWHTFKRSAPVDPEGNESPTSAPPPAKVEAVEAVATPTETEAVATPTETEVESEEEKLDDIDFHRPGWKSRYYLAKFQIEEDDVEFRRQIARDYVEGLCWVLKYYYQGCVSWDWYFPHHYAPFASDFDAIADFTPNFSRPTKPFNPLEQLMAVFPAASRAHIPEAWRALMTEADSPLFEFYPPDFEIDLNGKRFAWQGVALLPFVDQEKLLEELAKVYSKLTDEEKRRNIRGADRIFVKNTHQLFTALNDVFILGKESNFEIKKDAEGAIIHSWIPFEPSLAYGMAGEIAWDKDAVDIGAVYPSIFRNSIDYMDIDPNMCMMASFRDPVFPKGFKFPAIRLPGVVELERTLKPSDYNSRQNGNNYRPNVGFTRNRQYASLNDAGHRMVQSAVNNGGNGNNRGNGRGYYNGNNDRGSGGNNRGYYNGNNDRGRGNRYEQISYNESTTYMGYFSNEQPSTYGMPVVAPKAPLLSYPVVPQPPSFSDMAVGVPMVRPSQQHQHYSNRGGDRGSRGYYNRGRGGGHHSNDGGYDGGPRRGNCGGHYDQTRHRPYENRHQSHYHNRGSNNEGRGQYDNVRR